MHVPLPALTPCAGRARPRCRAPAVSTAAPEPVAAERVARPRPARACWRIPAFRRLWLALSLSSFGDWLGLLALTALAPRLAGGSYAAANLAVAGVFILRLAPAILIGPLAGVVADRLDRRWTMVVGDVARFALFLSIPLVGTLWWLFVATFLIEVASLFWIPAKEATVPNLVPRERLEAANQLSLFTTYGSAPVAAAVFAGLALVIGHARQRGAARSTRSTWRCSSTPPPSWSPRLTILRLTEIPAREPRAAGAEQPGVWRTLVEGWQFVGHTPLVRGLVVGMLGAFAAGGAVDRAGAHVRHRPRRRRPGLRPAVRHGLPRPGAAACASARGCCPTSAGAGCSAWPSAAAGLALAVLALIPNIVIAVFVTLVIGAFAGCRLGDRLHPARPRGRRRGARPHVRASCSRWCGSCWCSCSAVAPLLAAAFGQHQIEVTDAMSLTYNGAAFTFLLAGLLAAGLGFASYRQMDDRRGVPLVADLAAAYRNEPVGLRARRPARPGFFIAFEGGEGAGKSTQARAARATGCERKGHEVVLTLEPGATEVGRRLRAVLLDHHDAEGDAHAGAVAAGRGAAVRRRPGRARRDRRPCRRSSAAQSSHRPLHRLLGRLPGRRPRPGRPTRSPGSRGGPPRAWCRDLTVCSTCPPPIGLGPGRGAGPARVRADGVPRAGPRALPRAGPPRRRALPGGRRHAGRPTRSPTRSSDRLEPLLPLSAQRASRARARRRREAEERAAAGGRGGGRGGRSARAQRPRPRSGRPRRTQGRGRRAPAAAEQAPRPRACAERAAASARRPRPPSERGGRGCAAAEAAAGPRGARRLRAPHAEAAPAAAGARPRPRRAAGGPPPAHGHGPAAADPPTLPLSLADELFGAGDETVRLPRRRTVQRRAGRPAGDDDRVTGRLAPASGTTWSARSARSRCCAAAAAVGRGGAARRAGRPGMTHAWLFTGPPGSGRSDGRPGVRRGAAVPAAAAAATATRCHTVLAGTHADVEVVNTSTLSIGVKDARALVMPRRAAPGRRPLAGDRHRGRRPAHRPGRQRAAQGDRGADAAHGLAALRARRSRTCCRPSARAAATSSLRTPPTGGRRRRAGPPRRRRPGDGRVRGPRRAGPHRPGPAAGHRRGRPAAPARGAAAAAVAAASSAARCRPRPTWSTRPPRRPTQRPPSSTRGDRRACGARWASGQAVAAAAGARRGAQGAERRAEEARHPVQARRRRPRPGRPRRRSTATCSRCRPAPTVELVNDEMRDAVAGVARSSRRRRRCAASTRSWPRAPRSTPTSRRCSRSRR